MKKLLVFTALLEALTGLSLILKPLIVVRLLLGSEIAGAGILVSRVAGITLLALAMACWPEDNMRRAGLGMLTYNPLITLYLLSLAIKGWTGVLIYPVVALHAVLSILLFRTWRKEQQAKIPGRKPPNLTAAEVQKMKKVG